MILEKKLNKGASNWTLEYGQKMDSKMVNGLLIMLSFNQSTSFQPHTLESGIMCTYRSRKQNH